MTETLTAEAPATSFEQQQNPGTLPTGDELRRFYDQQFAEMELPSQYQLPQDPRYADRIFSVEDEDSPMSPEVIRQEFIAQATREAYGSSWWVHLSNFLKQYAVDPTQAGAIHLAAKHTLDIVHDDKPTDQQYEVFEVGDEEPDATASTVVFDTLQLVDQFSGGAIAANPKRPKIVLGNGIRLQENPNGEGEGLGFTNSEVIFINTSGLREVAARHGASFNELLAVTTVHEVLGHDLERTVMKDTGRYFPQFFDYSWDRSGGEIFKSVHTDIKPKDTSHAESQPVREYGQVSASEDFATSVDAVVAKSMDWTGSTNKYPRMRSEVDAHRRDLVIKLMDEAALAASKHDANPGIVGSEVRYVEDEYGQIAVEPARQLHITTVSGQEAARQEIDKQVQGQRPGEVFVVYDEDIM